MASEIRAIRPIPINISDQLKTDRLLITNVKFNISKAPKGSNTQTQTWIRSITKLYIVLHWHDYLIQIIRLDHKIHLPLVTSA